MENSTPEVLGNLRAELESAMFKQAEVVDSILTALTTTKEQAKVASASDSIKRMKDDGVFDTLVERYATLASEDASSRDDIVSDFELTIDYDNRVEVTDYSLDIEGVVRDALTEFLDEILFQLTHDYA